MNNSSQKALLIRTLSKHLHGDEQLSAYVLVDPILRAPFEQELLDDLSCEVFIVPAKSHSLEQGQEPRLIRLGPKAMELLEESISRMLEEQSDPQSEVARGFAMGGWLLTTASGSSLARHLAFCMRRTLYLKDTWKLFRWQDRRVMEWMWPALTLRQQGALLGPITQWWTLDRRDQLCVYSVVPSDDASAITSAGVVLSVEQRRHAERCELIQTVIRGWRSFSSGLPADYLRTVDQIVSMALEQGVESQQDVVLLAAYALQVHPQLLAHPQVLTMIDQAKDQVSPLSTLLGTVKDPQGWHAIRSDLESGNFTFGKNHFRGLANG